MRLKDMMTSQLPLFSLVLLQAGHALTLFADVIPNGGHIPNPCKDVMTGNKMHGGNTGESQFEKDFISHGKKWTSGLCRMDSDGDGRSNGEELGDPTCVWAPGTETKMAAVSHPGVCEPREAPACLPHNAWIRCPSPSVPTQPALQADEAQRGDGAHHQSHHDPTEPPLTLDDCVKDYDPSDITSLDLRLTKVKVPSKETTYMCQTFNLQLTSDFHMITVLPLIVATEVVHHILLFGYDPRVGDLPVSGEAYECGMMPTKTFTSLLGMWTMGSPGDCVHPDMGFRMGLRGYRQVIMQVHFNNPKHLEGIMDSSGLRIHLTKSLRSNDAGMLIVGQRAIQIDPIGWEEGNMDNGVSDNVTVTSHCPGRCTKHMFGDGIFITSTVNHMHSLGMSQRIEVYRDNKLVKTITNQTHYHYDHPIIYQFPEPIEVLPGDELRTTCVYKRPNSSQPVCFGQGTSDEMCFGFLTYFPSRDVPFPWCTSMKSLVSCDRHLPQLGRLPIDNCRWWEFREMDNAVMRPLVSRVVAACYVPGAGTAGKMGRLDCNNGQCRAAVANITNNPCMKGDMESYMINRIKQTSQEAQIIVDAIVTCSCRNLSYCDRQLPKRGGAFLGSTQAQWCPIPISGAHSSQTGRDGVRVLVLSLVMVVVAGLRRSLVGAV